MTKPMRWKMILYTAALFFAGVICGATVMSRMSANPQTLRLDRAPQIAAKIEEKLRTKLALNPQQLEKITPMIQKTSEELEASHRDDLKRISAAIDVLHAGIEPELNPEQKQKLLELEAERRETVWQKFHYRADSTNSTNR
ncbi:MAG: hypothetical protein JWR26_665 [Pedosphaera sp.]|nr:hypothetical protein [Pedosphaera sp.]